MADGVLAGPAALELAALWWCAEPDGRQVGLGEAEGAHVVEATATVV